MAELGTIGYIVGVVSFGVQLSTTLYSFTESAARAYEDITDIAGDVALTANMLNSVGNILKEEAWALVSESALQDAANILKRCDCVFSEIQQVIENRTKTGENGEKRVTASGRLAWPLKERRVELLRRRLDSLKTSLLLLLKVLTFANDRSRGKLEASSVVEERENIRLLHQRNQESLAILSLLEKKFDNVSIDDSETFRGSRSQPNMPVISFLNHQTLSDKGCSSSNQPEEHKSFDKADDYSSDDSDDTVGAEGMDNDDSLTNDDLMKCVKHVQKLLKRIEALQSLVSDSTKTYHRSKNRVRKVYRRFCQRFESEMFLQSNDCTSPFMPLPTFIPPSRARVSTPGAEEHHEVGEIGVSKYLEEPWPSQPTSKFKKSDFNNEPMNVSINKNQLTSSKTMSDSVSSNSSIEDLLEVRSLSSSDNGWNAVEFRGSNISLNASQTLDIRSDSDSDSDSDSAQQIAHSGKSIGKDTDQMPMETRETRQFDQGTGMGFMLSDEAIVLKNFDFDLFLSCSEPSHACSEPLHEFTFSDTLSEEQPLYINAKQYYRILKRRGEHQRLKDLLQAKSREPNLDSHGSQGHDAMEGAHDSDGQSLTPTVTKIESGSDEWVPNSGKESPVRKDSITTPENTLQGTYFSHLTSLALAAKNMDLSEATVEGQLSRTQEYYDALRDYQTSLMYLDCRTNSKRKSMARKEDSPGTDAKQSAQETEESGPITVVSQYSYPSCLAGQQAGGLWPQYVGGPAASDQEAVKQSADSELQAGILKSYRHEKRKPETQGTLSEHDGRHNIKRPRSDGLWFTPEIALQNQNQVAQHNSRPIPEVQEQAHWLPSQAPLLPDGLVVNPSLPAHSEEQSHLVLHKTQRPDSTLVPYPQEFQPLPDGFIPPLPVPAKGASAPFRPRHSEQGKERRNAMKHKGDPMSPINDEEVGGDTDVVDMLLARWTTLPATLMKE